VGNFTRDLCRVARAVCAVEAAPAAEALFRRNVPAGVEWVNADAQRDVARRVAVGERWDVVVLDPPREGARAVCAALPALEPMRIVYVSCDPMTLARDVAELGAAGYEPTRVTPVDLMPQTFHVETVAVLSRRRR
jgi:23S rRNA (uracil1939-C5)-methyltransferase